MDRKDVHLSTDVRDVETKFAIQELAKASKLTVARYLDALCEYAKGNNITFRKDYTKVE